MTNVKARTNGKFSGYRSEVPLVSWGLALVAVICTPTNAD